MRRAEVETLAATLMSFRRTVAVTAFPRAGLARVPAARVRLKAMQASTSQAALAVKAPDGKCASADAFMSAFKFSMTACWRWVLSALTVASSLASACLVCPPPLPTFHPHARNVVVSHWHRGEAQSSVS